MKVGIDIRSNNVTSNIIRSSASWNRRLTVLLAAMSVLAIFLAPLRVTWSLANAAPLTAATDTDPAHVAQMESMRKAVQSGADTDSVHAAQVAAYFETNSTPVAQATPQSASAVQASSLRTTDTDPAHIAQMESMRKAVQSGADTDSVHAAQVAAYFGTAVQAPTALQVATQQSAPAPAPVTSVNATISNSSNPLSGMNFYVNKYSSAATQANNWRQSRPGDASRMDTLAGTPTAQWFGEWSGDIQSAVGRAVSAAQSQGQSPVLVAYNIPQRDCGGYSAGGSNDYTNWIGAFARGIGSASAVVILEPDALAGISCLSQNDQQARLNLLSSAVSILKSNPNTKVYLDAGHSGWVDPSTMAGRLSAANVGKADGFATNVSNFMPTSAEASYGASVSAKVGGKHFVIDTSRNGNGSNGEWCNPWGRAVGEKPSTNTGNSLVDAYLWLKTPGESDGYCNGGPSAGSWWADYALSLVR